MSIAPSYVVTLVHGTFAPNALWLEENSELRRSITSALGEKVTFKIFRWTGANDHQTRATEADKLAIQLRATQLRYPDSNHFVLAHSHGGNIAIRALGAEDVRAGLQGVITMGTPFLASRARRTDLALLMLRFLIPVIFFLVGFAVVMTLVINVYDEHLFGMSKEASNLICQALALTCQILATVYARKLFRYIKGPFRDRILERQRKIDLAFAVSDDGHPNLLCGVAAGDEARGLLGLLRNMSNAWFLMFRLVASPFRIFWIFCVLLGWMIVLEAATDAVSVGAVSLVIFELLFGAFFVSMLLGPVMILVPRLVRAHRYGFGGESVLDNTLNDIGVSATPRGRGCDVYAVPFPWKLRPEHLQHGSFYRDEGFLKAASEWMQWVSTGRRDAPPPGVTHRTKDRVSVKRYTVRKRPLRICVVLFTGLMALISYFALEQDGPMQSAARAKFPERAWWFAPIERNLDLQPGVTPWGLKGIRFWTPEKGVAVGASGTVLRTVDGGKTWKAKSIDSGIALSSISMTEPGKMWLLSSGEMVTHLDVGKNDWHGRAIDGNPNDLNFVNEQCGWAVGKKGQIQHTTDGGRNWTAQTSHSQANLLRVQFVNEQEGWAAGSQGEVLHTVDSGADWVKQSSGVQATVQAMFFRSATQGWLGGEDGLMLATEDGGLTWRQQQTNSGFDLTAISFRDERVGVAVGEHGAMIATQNGGATWDHLFVSNSESLVDVTFAPDGVAWAAGAEGTILRSDKNGMNWKVVTSNGEQNYAALAVTAPDEAWVAGSGGVLLHTTDGGNFWGRSVADDGVDVLQMGKEPLESIAFPTRDAGWAVGSFGRVIHTTDRGRNWEPQRVPTLEGLHGVAFISATEGWIAASKGLVLHTRDAGQTWLPQRTGTEANLYHIVVVSGQELWTGGAGGTILHTSNGGEVWVKQTSGTAKALYEFAFTSPLHGTVVGQANTMLHTSDGGLTWKDASDQEGRADIASVVMVSQDKGWAVGPPKTLYDAFEEGAQWGISWASELKPMTEPLRSIRFADRQTGWIVGLGGTIFRTTDGASHWEKQGYRKYPGPWLYFVLAGLCVALGMLLFRYREEESTGISDVSERIG